MTRALLAGSVLNEISGSLNRRPGFKVEIYNPIRVPINDVASGRPTDPPLDISPYVESVEIEENVGYENATDPSPTRATIAFRKNLPIGRFRRGWIADGVIVRISEGDLRVRKGDWVPVFTGTFRGRPGENPGSRSDLSEGLSAIAFSREERYINSAPVTTEAFPAGIDLGEIAYNIAWKYMGLGVDEILFGAFGFKSLHVSNQIADLPPLDALYQCGFPVGKKPRFDALGRLVFVDTDLDKPATRIYSNGDRVIRSIVASPNDIEVNNQVILRGLNHNKTKVIQDPQILNTIDLTTGFFDAEVRRETWYSEDRSQKAQDTYLVPKHRIAWSEATWEELDEFHGVIDADTHFLATVREIIFAAYLAVQLEIAALDLAAQESGGFFSFVSFGGGPSLRFALQVASQVLLAGLLWSMNYIGRGEYEIWGSPFEYVFQELVTDARLVGLDPEELRPYDYRNDFISTEEDLDRIAEERLRREVLKNQLFEVEILADQKLEVDDVFETTDGSRYYILSVRKSLRRGGSGFMRLTCWLIGRNVLAGAEPLTIAPGPGGLEGFGTDFGAEAGDS